MQTTDKWKKEFNKRFVEFYPSDSGIGGNDPQEPDEVLQAYPHEIRDFIESLLNEARREVIKDVEHWHIKKGGYTEMAHQLIDKYFLDQQN